mmetsp:Transcript_78478/g.123772  ORF Transcript_78478/g.123772 Transcript_78478/m.123772 type:complete len:613 (-) Transcript_78478:36-1874(-)
MIHVSAVRNAMWSIIGSLPWLCGAAHPAPVGLIRKHPQSHLSITAQGALQGLWETHDRAPTGHKFQHLHGFQAAFEEMQAIEKAAEERERWDAVKQQLEEECAAAGESCKKSIGLVKDQNPEDKEAKMEYLCTSQALSCLSANMGKCGAFHEEVMEIQKQWQCEAMRCSAAGPNCSTAITFLEMDDSKLTDETRHKKSRFLCSKEAKQCLTDHKDICKTGFDIVSTAMEMGHCDKILCSEKGDDCRTAVTFLTQDPVSNVTVKESKEKWSYLCGDAAFHCLEKNLEQCTRYYNSLKLAFAEGHCNSARCAGEGPDCARMVDYLSQPDKFYYGEELRNKTKFLCGDKGIACIMEHGTCAEFQEAAKKEYKSLACGRSEHAQVEMPTLPPDGQVDARSDAERAYAKQKIKEKEEKEKKMLETAKAQKGENPKVKVVKSGADDEEGSTSKDQRESTDSEHSEAQSNKKPAMTKEEKEKAGKKIFAALVVGVVAIGGFIYWRRRSSKSATGSEGTSPTASPKPKKPPRPKLEMLQKMKEQATSAVTNTGSALAARLKAFSGLGMFKKAAASTEEVKVEESKPDAAEPATATAPAAPAAAAKAPAVGETGPEEPKEY